MEEEKRVVDITKQIPPLRRKVLILTNLPQRDKTTDEVLAYHLRNLGFEARVVDLLPRNRNHILFYKPDIVVLPEIRCEYTVEMCEILMSWGVTVVAKRCEGGTSQGAWDVMTEAERETVVSAWRYDVDLELVWSEKFADLLGKEGHLPREKIFAAGAMPLDVYFNQPTPVKPYKRRNIMFATGWSHADRSPDYNVPEAPHGSPIHKDAWERHRNGREKWIKMMVRTIEKLGRKWDFYLRLKVGEFPIEYQKSLADKVKLLMPCPTHTALANCDMLIHSGSTMGIEAHLMNIPALSYYGLINQTAGYNYPHVSPDFEDMDKLIEAVEKTELGKSNANIESVKELEREFYGTMDGKACERAAKAIEALPVKTPVIPDVWPESTKSYTSPNISKMVEQWVCECCGKSCYAFPSQEMIKCVWCGISLARRKDVKEMMIDPVGMGA